MLYLHVTKKIWRSFHSIPFLSMASSEDNFGAALEALHAYKDSTDKRANELLAQLAAMKEICDDIQKKYEDVCKKYEDASARVTQLENENPLTSTTTAQWVALQKTQDVMGTILANQTHLKTTNEVLAKFIPQQRRRSRQSTING